MEPPLGAADASESAGNLLKIALGSFFSWILSAEEFHSAEAAARMPDVPYVWADGSLVLDEVTVSPLQVRFFFFCSTAWSQLECSKVGSC